jgi:hypothetical protein
MRYSAKIRTVRVGDIGLLGQKNVKNLWHEIRHFVFLIALALENFKRCHQQHFKIVSALADSG